jgi:amino acid permease
LDKEETALVGLRAAVAVAAVITVVAVAAIIMAVAVDLPLWEGSTEEQRQQAYKTAMDRLLFLGMHRDAHPP